MFSDGKLIWEHLSWEQQCFEQTSRSHILRSVRTGMNAKRTFSHAAAATTTTTTATRATTSSTTTATITTATTVAVALATKNYFFSFVSLSLSDGVPVKCYANYRS